MLICWKDEFVVVDKYNIKTRQSVNIYCFEGICHLLKNIIFHVIQFSNYLYSFLFLFIFFRFSCVLIIIIICFMYLLSSMLLLIQVSPNWFEWKNIKYKMCAFDQFGSDWICLKWSILWSLLANPQRWSLTIYSNFRLFSSHFWIALLIHTYTNE